MVPAVLVGAKSDLDLERQVTTEEGKTFAEKLGCHFFETSAKDRINVREVFEELVRAVQKSKEQWKNIEAHKSKSSTCVIM